MLPVVPYPYPPCCPDNNMPITVANQQWKTTTPGPAHLGSHPLKMLTTLGFNQILLIIHPAARCCQIVHFDILYLLKKKKKIYYHLVISYTATVDVRPSDIMGHSLLADHTKKHSSVTKSLFETFVSK